MKVYVLTEIDLRHVGYSPNTIQVFATYDEAVREMEDMYAEALKKFKTNEDSGENAFSAAEGYAYVGDADYRLDINECVINSRFYSITTIQELTVVAEEMGVREKLMAERNLSRDEVWLLMQTWADEFLDKYFKECEKVGHTASQVSYYDMIDEFVEKKNKELDAPEIERVTSPETDEMCLCDKGVFGDVREYCVRVTASDGKATGDGVTLSYPKVSELTAEQIQAIDEYTGGRVSDSGCVTPWDVCLLYGKITAFGIMDTGQNHDAELVRRINLAWMEDKEKFRPVLVALYDRDLNEILYGPNCCVFGWPEAADTDYVYAEMQCSWDKYAGLYLKYVGDDLDLQCVLDFVRK